MLVPRSGHRGLLAVAVPVLAGSGVVLAAVWSGRRYVKDPDIKLGAAPLVGSWEWRPTALILPAVVLALLTVAFGESTMRRLRAGWAITVAAAVTAGFSVLLAAADGASAMLEPVVDRTEYWANLPTLPPAGEMVRRHSDISFLLNYSVHVKGHPPGFLLVLKALAAIGLGAPWAVAAVQVIGTALMTVGVLLTTRIVAGREAMTRTAPFLAVIPFALWTAMSADGYFAGTAAIAVGVGAHALVAPSRRRRVCLAVLCGLLLGWSFILGYGAATFLAVPAAVLIGTPGPAVRERVEAGVGAFLGFVAVIGGFALAGYWWWDGLNATRNLYWWGTAQFRPWRYFLLSNLAVICIAVGPAVIAGLGSMPRIRDRRWWLLGGAVVALTVTNLSQYSKGETERIWLLFFPWLVPAVAHLSRRRAWLVLQATSAIVLQVWLVSKW
jgi:methylthioxylose transferase